MSSRNQRKKREEIRPKDKQEEIIVSAPLLFLRQKFFNFTDLENLDGSSSAKRGPPKNPRAPNCISDAVSDLSRLIHLFLDLGFGASSLGRYHAREMSELVGFLRATL